MPKRNLILILILATFLAYFSSFGNPFIWDDEQFITSNQYVQNFDIGKIFTTSTTAGAGIQSNYYRPLTTLSFAIDKAMWGLNVFGFHLTNLLFHVGVGLVLFGLLGLLGMGEIPAFFIALFFLVHPVQVEAVTYINSRGDSLFSFFLFSSLWLFASSLRGRSEATDAAISNGRRLLRFARNDVLRGVGVVFLFILSLLSKETALAGVGLYIICGIWYLVFRKRDLSPIKYQIQNTTYIMPVIVSIIVLVLAYVFLRLTLLNFGNTLNFYGVQNEYTRSLAIRFFTFCKVVWIYLGLLIWPYPLHMERNTDIVRTIFSPYVISLFILVLGFISLGWIEFKKLKTSWIWLGLVWFFGMLVPASGIIPINGILYEHWLYVPSIGIWVMGYGIWRLVSSLSLRGALATKRHYEVASTLEVQTYMRLPRFLSVARNDTRKLLLTLGVILAVIYIVLTIRQNNIWSDPVGFYTYTLQFAPWSARLHNNLGMTLANEGNAKDAIPEYKKALTLGESYPQIYNNLGNAQIATGDYKDAEVNLKKALQLSPDFAVVKLNLIRLYIAQKEFDKARKVAEGDSQLLQFINTLPN